MFVLAYIFILPGLVPAGEAQDSLKDPIDGVGIETQLIGEATPHLQELCLAPRVADAAAERRLRPRRAQRDFSPSGEELQQLPIDVVDDFAGCAKGRRSLLGRPKIWGGGRSPLAPREASPRCWSRLPA